MAAKTRSSSSTSRSLRRTLRRENERERGLTMQHRWYAGGIATLLAGALIFTGITPAVADVVPPPADETTTAAEETAPPTDDATTPADEAGPPAEEATPPADESTPPADESTPPADESTPPVDETVPPADETVPPADDSNPPSVGRLSAPQDDALVGPLAVIAADCDDAARTCGTVTFSNAVVGGTATVDDWTLLADQTAPADNDYEFTSGETRTVERPATYTLSSTAVPGTPAESGYSTVITCVQVDTQGNTRTSFGNSVLQFFGTGGTTAGLSVTCTATHTFAAPATATINVNVGGDRTGLNSIAPLPGVTLRLYSGDQNGPNNPFTAAWATCVSNATGDCTFTVPNVETPMQGNSAQQNGGNGNRQFWIQQENQPAGWHENFNDSIATGTSGQTQTLYTVRTPAMTSGASFESGTNFMLGTGNTEPRASGGVWQVARDNPSFPNRCGIDIALIVDLSGSLSGQLQQIKDASNAMVTALEGTNSSVGVYTFASNAPATAGGNLASTQVATADGANTVRAHINSFTTPTGGTNWDRGIGQVPTGVFDLAIVVTDGNPTFYGNAEGPGSYTRFREVENGIFSANRLKAPQVALGNIGTRMVSLGVGDGIGGPANNLIALSGPNQNSDYFQAATFTGAAAVLRALALGQCLGSLTIVKQVVPNTNTNGDITGAQPAGGWDFTATTPAPNSISGSPGATVGGTGAVNFPMTFASGVTSANVAVTENIAEFPGYAIYPVNGSNATCTATALGGAVTPVPVQNTNVPGSPGFTLAVPSTQSVSCIVYNKPPLPQSSIVVDKFWRVNGTTFANADFPFAANNVSASLTIAGTPQTWGDPRGGFTAGATVQFSETKTPFPPVLELCSHTAVEVRNAQGAIVSSAVPYTTLPLASGLNSYSITNVVVCQSQLILKKDVANGTALPTAWDLTAYRPDASALVGPTGKDGVTGFVTPAVRYALGEANGPGTYLQVVVPGATITPPSTGSWSCQQVDANGTVISAFNDGQNGGVTPPPGARIRCTATNQTATLILLKEIVNDDGGAITDPSAWSLTATPASNTFGLLPVVTPGATTANSSNTFNVRPGHVYTISESTVPGYAATKLQQLVGLNWVDVVGFDVSVPVLGTGTFRIVNDDIAPHLTLTKHVDNKNGVGSANASAWTLHGVAGATDPKVEGPGAPATGPTASITGVVEGGLVYTLSETGGAAGYTPGAWSCVLTGTTTPFEMLSATTIRPVVGQDVTCEITNTVIPATGTITKIVKPGFPKQNPDFSWAIEYEIHVVNDSSTASLIYSLSDALKFGGGIVPTAATWSGPVDTDIPFTMPAGTATMATNATLAPSGTAIYTVKVTATITAGVGDLPANSACSTTTPTPANGGFLNAATLSVTGTPDSTAYACKPPAFPTITKDGTATQTPAGSWNVQYTIAVTNPSTGDNAAQIQAVLSDAFPAAPAGWTLTGNVWNVAAQSPAPPPTAPTYAPGTHTIWTGALPANTTYTYVVTGVLTPTAAATPIGDCAVQGQGLLNKATVTSGPIIRDATKCVTIVTPGVTITKAVTSTVQLADGTWRIGYDVVVTNQSSTVAAVYSLTDTLAFGGAIVIDPAQTSWSGPTGTSQPFSFPAGTAAMATNRALAPHVGAAGVETYSVTVHASIPPGAWTANPTTLDCLEGEPPSAGGFLNTALVMANGVSTPADACSEPELPTIAKTGLSVVLGADVDHWIVSYEITVTPSGFDSFYTLKDIPGFPTGVTIDSGTAQRTDTDPDGDPIAITEGGTFPAAPVPIGAADAPHKWKVTWQVAITGSVDPGDIACTGVPGKGFYNLAQLLQNGQVIDDGSACIPVIPRVYPTFDKTVTSTTQDPATGIWTIVYKIDVSLAAAGSATNPNGLPSRYGLTDTLNFGGGITVVTDAGQRPSWQGETGPAHEFDAPGYTSATLATLTQITAGDTHTYTVTVHARVTAAAIPGDTTACKGGEPPAAGGFLNTALLSSTGQQTPDTACAEPLFPTIEKAGSTTTPNGDGTWNISYLVTVSYPDSAVVPLPGTIGYNLSDVPTLPTGVTAPGGWTAAAADASTPAPTDTTWATGDPLWTVVSGGALTAENKVHTYRISATVTVAGAPTTDPLPCTDTHPTGIVIPNVGTVTSGGYTATDQGCQVVQFDDVGIEKTSSLGPTGSVEAGQTFDYILTVTNHGTRAATNVRVTDSDFNNRLDISNLVVSAGVTWQTPPGWTENGGSQPNDRVDLTIDSLAVGQSATITITVSFQALVTAVGTAIHQPLETPPLPPAPLDNLNNTACVSATPDSVPGNNCDTLDIPVREITGVLYTSCESDAPLLGWIIRKSPALAGSLGSAAWIPLYGTATTDPAVVNYSESSGDDNPDPLIWSDLARWPGTAFTPAGVAIDYPGWRPIEAGDMAPDGGYINPATGLEMTPVQQALLVFNGLIVDPSELDFAWRQTPIPPETMHTSRITFTVNPTLVFEADYPPATPECFQARHSTVEVEKTASVDQTDPGTSFTYDLAVQNVSDDSAAEAVVVTDAIPADIKITDVAWEGEGDDTVFPNWESCEVTGQNASGYGGNLECVLFGPLQPVGANSGASAAPTITLMATVNPSATTSVITNVAYVDYHTFGQPEDTGRDMDDATITLSSLPATGGEVALPLLVLGFLSLLGGIAMVIVMRRRRGNMPVEL